MSNSFNEDKKRGDDGAAKVQEFLKGNNNCCWRYKTSYRGSAAEHRDCDIPCKQNRKHRYFSVEDSTGYQTLYDVDVLTMLDCEGCPCLDDWEPSKVPQYHEIKTNDKTHKKMEPTQNLYIEVINNTVLYEREGWSDWTKNPKTGNMERVRQGVGWFAKRDEIQRMNRNGEPYTTTAKDRLADWYHFYQEFDNRDILTATPEEADRFRNDASIGDGAQLLKSWPIPYCISISGAYLDALIKSGRYTLSGFPYTVRNKTTGEAYDTWNKGYYIPVIDIVGGHLYFDTNPVNGEPVIKGIETANLWNSQHVKVNFIGWKGIKHGDGDCKDLYIPQRFIDAIGDNALFGNMTDEAKASITEAVKSIGFEGSSLNGAYLIVPQPKSFFQAERRNRTENLDIEMGIIKNLGFIPYK